MCTSHRFDSLLTCFSFSRGIAFTFHQPSFGSFSWSSPGIRNSTYSDINRQHVGLSPFHLEHLAQSVALQSATATTTAMDHAPANILLQATSSTESNTRTMGDNNTGEGTRSPGRGRTLQDAIVLEDNNDALTQQNSSTTTGLQLGGGSILQNPALLQRGKDSETSETNDMIVAERNEKPLPTMTIQSSFWDVGHQTAEGMRQLLSLRETIQSTMTEIQSLESSLTMQKTNLAQLHAQVLNLQHDPALSPEARMSKTDDLVSEQQGCDRVISQLQRKLMDLNQTLSLKQSELVSVESKARSLEKKRRSMVTHFNDPFTGWKGPLAKGSSVGGCKSLRMVLGRQHGLSRSLVSSQRPARSNIARGLNPHHFMAARKNLLETQLSHAITINTHLNTPVYCVHFDRTGRYFITGADDYLVKVFCLGAAQSCRTRNERNGSRRLRCNYGANFRGAVLVCSLRGHAGVINDIDVSSDNCFLATASTDQDVRIWGLKDGCPIAILRGHQNGANMVSWSTLTPYRLVTTASDGFARVWDIREASLKRYGKFVGKREEYKLQLTQEEKQSQTGDTEGPTAASSTTTEGGVPADVPSPSRTTGIVGVPLASGPPALPPLPVAGNSRETSIQNPVENHENGSAAEVAIPAPPLPGAGPPAAANDESNQNEGGQVDEEDQAEPGDFVMNDLIDEGVKLVLKYRHGSSQDAQQQGPGTRSRRTAINVICVARCPLGNQFATGSDDGIVRVWQDFDDNDVAVVDKRHIGGASDLRTNAKPPPSGVESKPLLKLTGHVSTITDLVYSHAGDRIVSASQKDGVARIWNVASAIASNGADKTVTQIVIKLKDPSAKKPAQTSRRRPGNSTNTPSSKVSCEVAVWTHDDSYVITSQCVLLKQGGNEIQPGSQFIFIWLSCTGQCIMGISGAHTMPCNVVLPHPTDSSIICTASDDGWAKVWDLTQGKCIYSHQNTVEYGPIDPNDSGGGDYLDGSFSPDGTVIVLSDSRGQISVFDCISKQENPSNDGNALSWMREQYFSNDYYELFYDTNGYCIEKGSKQPPHLAPKSRCTHNGSSFPGADDITETFKRLAGPSPLPENVCRWNRDEHRRRTLPDISGNNSTASTGIRIAVREFDPNSTLLLKGVGHLDANENVSEKKARQSSTTASTQGNNSRTLSQRFNYLGYDDLLMREGPDDDGPESEDEEFEPTTAAARGRRLDGVGDDSEDEDNIDDLSLESYEENHRRRRNRGNIASSNTAEDRRARSLRRARRNTNMGDFMEIDSDDEATEQYMSINKTANGPYLRDFERDGHLWKLKNLADADKVHRRWLRREESDLSYLGKKFYAPQIGDSVVYIPRAHYETIKEYPSLLPPWQEWPAGSAWPIVRCSVQNIRYRFPYEDYFRHGNQMCRSIVAIVTLQVTGVPEISVDPEVPTERDFPWPKPSFVEPSTSCVFEVSVFENAHEDFLIPEFLYSARLESLEKNVRDRGMTFAGLPVDLFYSDGNSRREDSELQPWASTVTDVNPEDLHSETHLNGSGFCVLSFAGVDEDNFEDSASPWEINTEGLILRRPSLTEDEEKAIMDALNELLEKEEISEYFKMPVDQVRYYDYGVMIELPMDLMFVKRRLKNRYYGSKLSVVADLRLIRDNCIKYNTGKNEISKAAIEMCREFEEKILTPEERSQLISEEDFEKIREDQSNGRQSSNLRIRLSARTIRLAQQAAAAASASSGGTYSLRDRSGIQRRSSLEQLPAPEANAARSRSAELRQGGGSQLSNAPNATRGGRYSLRGQGAGNRTETLARLRAVESREERAARRNRAAGDQSHARGSARNNDEEEEDEIFPNSRSTRRSARSQRAEQPRYQDPDSDADEQEQEVEEQNDEEEEEEEEGVPPARGSRSRRTARTSASTRTARAANRRQLRDFSDEEESEVSEEEEEEEASVDGDESVEDSDDMPSDSERESGEEPPARASRRNGRGNNRTSSKRASRPTRAAGVQSMKDSPGRRSQRSAAKRTTYRDIENSDFEEYAEESSDAEDDDEEESPPPTNSRRRKRVSYAEESSDEEESDHENVPRRSNKRKSRGRYSVAPQLNERTTHV